MWLKCKLSGFQNLYINCLWITAIFKINYTGCVLNMFPLFSFFFVLFMHHHCKYILWIINNIYLCSYVHFKFYSEIKWFKAFLSKNMEQKSSRTYFSPFPSLAKEHHGREKRAAEEPQTPVSGSASLLVSDCREALLCPGLCKWRRGTCANIHK